VTFEYHELNSQGVKQKTIRRHHIDKNGKSLLEDSDKSNMMAITLRIQNNLCYKFVVKDCSELAITSEFRVSTADNEKIDKKPDKCESGADTIWCFS